MSKLTVEEKFAKAIIVLRHIRPFYSAIYEAVEKVRMDSIPTIGVTADKMVYNYEYIDKLTFEQFMFDILHEIAHIALMHVVRTENRDNLLWNIACDLYVNKLLAEEFNLSPNSTNQQVKITMGSSVVFDSEINTETDTAEELYAYLDEQANEMGYYSSTNSDKVYVFRTCRRSINTININKNSELSNDLMDDGSDYNTQDDKCRKVLVDAQTRSEMMGQEQEAGKLEEMVSAILSSKVDWKKLLRKYCIQYKSKDLSFSSPDRRMYYQSAIYPGVGSESEEQLRNVKLCKDTSGSISDRDLGHFMGQILQLTKAFKTTVEVIDWDTDVEQTYELTGDKISNTQEHKVVGRGGTNPACLFEYFESKKCKVKPFVTIIFTDGFFFGQDFKSSWAKKYKNTIWVMTKEHNREFKPEFGKVAYAQFNG